MEGLVTPCSRTRSFEARTPQLGAQCTNLFAQVEYQGSAGSADCEIDVQAQGSNDEYDDQFQKGLDLLRRHKYEEALKSFKRANEMRDKKSAESYLGMATAYQGLEAHKNVVENCDKVLELAAGDTVLRLQAYNLKGLAYQSQAEGKNQKKLQDAEAVFRQGLALESTLPIFHYNLGFVLMQQSRDPEGRYASRPMPCTGIPCAANTSDCRANIDAAARSMCLVNAIEPARIG